MARDILLSHDTGASGRDLAWLAEPLAQAGFLVAAVDHHGNNWVDGYAAPGLVWERPADLRHVLDLVQRQRRADWVGAAGFSAGGYAAAALVGVRLDPDLIKLLAEGEIPDPALPEYPGAFEWLRRTTTKDTIGGLMRTGRVLVATSSTITCFPMTSRAPTYEDEPPPMRSHSWPEPPGSTSRHEKTSPRNRTMRWAARRSGSRSVL
jgi:hypothetical protein